MTSNIHYEGIDPTFPISGRNNSTQGFRDNFTVIQDCLKQAATEISTLQTETIPGASGPSGNTGATGIAGPTGTIGSTGPMGATGVATTNALSWSTLIGW